jgi:hypothetical protein
MASNRDHPTQDGPTPSREQQDQPAAQDGSKDAPYRALRQPTHPRTTDGPDARENEEPRDSLK